MLIINNFTFYIFVLLNIILLDLYYLYLKIRKDNIQIPFDKYETNIFEEIKSRLLLTKKCSLMWQNQKEFLNGIIRKFRPEKVLEIGVKYGGSSIIILNAIKDIPNSKLFSIDIDDMKHVGKCVYGYFQEFTKKWKLFQGSIAAKYMEDIGKNIDMVIIDSAHFEPGEILDVLMVLPFLKEEAVLIFHDIGNQITDGLSHTENGGRKEWAPYIIFNLLRGKKFLPSGGKILTNNIGAVKLEKNQYRFIYDYFRALGGQWAYFPKEKYIKLLRDYFKKYYDEYCMIIFEEAIKFNRLFVKRFPSYTFYKKNSD